MTVRAYYYQNFNQLSEDKKFHFATRIKNYFGSHDFDQFFTSYMPSTNLKEIYQDNNYSKVAHAELRAPLFKKYDHLFAIEAMLFRTLHLLHEYRLDLRQDFTKIVPLAELYRLSDALLADDEALVILSTWAVNTICLAEILFPRGQNAIKILAEKSLKLKAKDPLLSVYLYTHIIICDSEFYTKPLTEKALAQELLNKAFNVIKAHPAELALDSQIEFLVCANMAEANYPALRQKIAAKCHQILENSPFLVDVNPSRVPQTINGKEHTNVLYIMSGLDS